MDCSEPPVRLNAVVVLQEPADVVTTEVAVAVSLTLVVGTVKPTEPASNVPAAWFKVWSSVGVLLMNFNVPVPLCVRS